MIFWILPLYRLWLLMTAKHLEFLVARIEKEKAFLLREGWTFEEETPKHPEMIAENKGYGVSENAVYQTVDRILKRDGWFPVIVITKYPKSKLRDNEFCFYSHVKYNRLFLFEDLVTCCIYKTNPAEITSEIAKRYARSPSLSTIKYTPGLKLVVNMWIEGSKLVYELVEK